MTIQFAKFGAKCKHSIDLSRAVFGGGGGGKQIRNTSIFSFSHDVFIKPVLCGKELQAFVDNQLKVTQMQFFIDMV